MKKALYRVQGNNIQLKNLMARGVGFMVHGKRLIKKMAFDFLPSSTVLMFHHIDDGNIIVRSGCRLSKKSFVDILDSGISFISAEEYTQFVFSWKNPCLITFDDGLKDVYRVAYPELKKRNIPFTVFIVTDFLDQEGYLSSKELQVLADDPLVTIGSHGTTHKILHGMDEAEQRMELLDSKHILEEKTGKIVWLFAYSHGQFDDTTLRILQTEKCYDYAFAAGGGETNWITKKTNFTLPRLNMEEGLQNYRIYGSSHCRLKQLL